MKKTLTIILLSVISFLVSAQKELIMTQYIHNQFAINSAFAGSRETLSAFALYRMQWNGIPNAPNTQYLSLHAPLKNDRIAIGANFFNEKISIVHNTGFSLAYAHRVRINQNSRIAISLKTGLLSSKSDWSDLKLTDKDDLAFIENETFISPILGMGIAWYGDNFFAGFSIPDLFYSGSFNYQDPSINLAETNYIITTGYIYNINPQLSVQPSTLIRYNTNKTLLLDISANLLIQNMIWAGMTYRNNKEIIMMAGWQASSQLRVAYSFDYPMGDLNTLNSGSHELSLQYDFGYKINTVNPRFF